MAPIIRRPQRCGRRACPGPIRSTPRRPLRGSSGARRALGCLKSDSAFGPTPNSRGRPEVLAGLRSRSGEHIMLIRRAVAGMIDWNLGLTEKILAQDDESRIQPMKRPVVGVIGNAHRVENRFATQMVGERNLRAVADVSGALPLMFAGSPEITDIGALLDAVDGVVLTGARANVHPTRFRTEPHERHEPYDQ